MSKFLEYVWLHSGAIAVLLGALVVSAGLVQWVAWMFRLGRFRTQSSQSVSNPLRYVAANFFVEIINDFRHLLALVIVILFALALFAGMYPGLRSRNVQEIATGVQAVAAALAGLIGSIIGYYFGESAATQRMTNEGSRDASTPVQPGGVSVQAGDGGTRSSDIVPAPPLPKPPQNQGDQ